MRLRAPAGRGTRPSTDRVREATFNALGSLGALTDATVLDLFAGSGALGIEALSRGAAHVTFVEVDRSALAALRANLSRTGMQGRCEVLVRPARQVLDAAVTEGRRWDLALLDPPYAFSDWEDLLGRLPADVAVLESDRAQDVPAGWVQLRSKRYGRTTVAILERAVPERGGRPLTVRRRPAGSTVDRTTPPTGDETPP